MDRGLRYLVTNTLTLDDDSGWPGRAEVIDEVKYVEGRFKRFRPKLRGLAARWYEFQFGLYLLRRSRKYDAFAVGRFGIWFPILQRLVRSHKPVVMMDTEWRSIQTGRVNRAAAMASIKICCFTNEEVKRYARQSRIPQSRFGFVPACFQHRDQRPATDSGFVFAGGLQNRDWRTLLEAVDGLPYAVRLFTNQQFASLPSNVSVRLVGREEYYSQMAAASCVAVPVGAEPLRINGIATWTNAMAMGKVVIATEPLGAPDYMDQGISGFYVNYGDVEALRECIIKVMSDPSLRQRVGAAARERAHKEFSPEVFKRRILALLEGNHPRISLRQ